MGELLPIIHPLCREGLCPTGAELIGDPTPAGSALRSAIARYRAAVRGRCAGIFQPFPGECGDRFGLEGALACLIDGYLDAAAALADAGLGGGPRFEPTSCARAFEDCRADMPCCSGGRSALECRLGGLGNPFQALCIPRSPYTGGSPVHAFLLPSGGLLR